MYLLSAVADLYLETGEKALWEAADRLWRDITGSKMYITGGLGSRYEGESFGESYELPPDLCYCETCAAIGSLMWNWRLLLVTGEARYADLIEQTLYNGILSSPLDGRHFFYVNPLMLRSERSLRQSANPPEGSALAGRPEWHYVACCPPNVMRLFASLAHYLVTMDQNGIQVHQFAPAEIRLTFGAGRQATLSMETGYPWEDTVRLKVERTDGQPWQLRLRLPGWCQAARLSLNGQEIRDPELEEGYLGLNRAWLAGDMVQLELNMAPVLVESNPRVDAIRDCLAIQRGPLVFCLEAADNPGLNVMDIQIDENAPLVVAWRADRLPEGMMVVQTKGYVVNREDREGRLYRPPVSGAGPEQIPGNLVAIPYYAWAQRGLDGMRVWIPRARV